MEGQVEAVMHPLMRKASSEVVRIQILRHVFKEMALFRHRFLKAFGDRFLELQRISFRRKWLARTVSRDRSLHRQVFSKGSLPQVVMILFKGRCQPAQIYSEVAIAMEEQVLVI
jgi:hypothetical protein